MKMWTCKPKAEKWARVWGPPWDPGNKVSGRESCGRSPRSRRRCVNRRPILSYFSPRARRAWNNSQWCGLLCFCLAVCWIALSSRVDSFACAFYLSVFTSSFFLAGQYRAHAVQGRTPWPAPPLNISILWFSYILVFSNKRVPRGSASSYPQVMSEWNGMCWADMERQCRRIGLPGNPNVRRRTSPTCWWWSSRNVPGGILHRPALLGYSFDAPTKRCWIECGSGSKRNCYTRFKIESTYVISLNAPFTAATGRFLSNVTTA